MEFIKAKNITSAILFRNTKKSKKNIHNTTIFLNIITNEKNNPSLFIFKSFSMTEKKPHSLLLESNQKNHQNVQQQQNNIVINLTWGL